MKVRIVIILIYFFSLLSSVNTIAQPLTGFGITAGLLINNPYKVWPPEGTGHVFGYISNVKTVITAGWEASASLQTKLRNSKSIGIYADVGIMYARSLLSYQDAGISNWPISDSEVDHYYDKSLTKGVYTNIYLHTTLALQLYPFDNKRIYFYGGLRLALVLYDLGSETSYDTLITTQVINNISQPPPTASSKYVYLTGTDNSLIVEAVGGIGLRMGKPQSGRFSIEAGGYNNFVPYQNVGYPTFKRDGLELKLLYRFKKRTEK